jgi:hypothetical protein
VGVKRPGRGVDQTPSSSAEVKEGVDLYLYSPLGLRGLLEGEPGFTTDIFNTLYETLTCYDIHKRCVETHNLSGGSLKAQLVKVKVTL